MREINPTVSGFAAPRLAALNQQGALGAPKEQGLVRRASRGVHALEDSRPAEPMRAHGMLDRRRATRRKRPSVCRDSVAAVSRALVVAYDQRTAKGPRLGRTRGVR